MCINCSSYFLPEDHDPTPDEEAAWTAMVALLLDGDAGHTMARAIAADGWCEGSVIGQHDPEPSGLCGWCGVEVAAPCRVLRGSSWVDVCDQRLTRTQHRALEVARLSVDGSDLDGDQPDEVVYGLAQDAEGPDDGRVTWRVERWVEPVPWPVPDE